MRLRRCWNADPIIYVTFDVDIIGALLVGLAEVVGEGVLENAGEGLALLLPSRGIPPDEHPGSVLGLSRPTNPPHGLNV